MCSLSTGAVEVPYSARFHPGQTGRHPDGTQLVEGLQMDQEFSHVPVMSVEVVELLAPVPRGVVVDATVGGGGHSAAILSAHPGLSVLGLDRDPAAVAASTARLARFGGRARVTQARFDRIGQLTAGLDTPVVGALFDLGVSSPQLDRPERGFSYRRPGPLDMRMDPSASLTAAEVVNTYPESRLAELFRASGEGRWAGRIARAIVAARPVRDTGALAEVVAAGVPAAHRRRGNPASRVFQALRIEVNEELSVLAAALVQLPGILAPRGRVIVLSYHSGEDRMVKAHLAAWATGGCTCPPGLPCVCGARPVARLLNRGARRPGASEVAANPRAASARLRAAEMLPTGQWREEDVE